MCPIDFLIIWVFSYWWGWGVSCLEFKEAGTSADRDLQSFAQWNPLEQLGLWFLGFPPGAITPQRAWFSTPPTRSTYLGALGCFVGVLPVCKEGIQGSSEGSNGTAVRVKISCGQYPLGMSSLLTIATTLWVGASQTNCLINISPVGPGPTLCSLPHWDMKENQ